MSWKDCKEWETIGLPISTTNNEAAKMYDAVVTQYMSGFEDESVGGMAGAIEKMKAADEHFVYVPIISNGLQLMGMGTSAWNNPELKRNIEDMVERSEKDNTLQWKDKLHISALKLLSEGNFPSAGAKWEEILLRHPTDMLAFRFAIDSYFYNGNMAQLRDCAARIMPYWKSERISPSMYGYLKSLYSFGLEETHFYGEAEKEALQALELNERDGWATHSLTHVMEMQCRYDEGIQFVLKKAPGIQNHFFKRHVYWHLGIFYIEKGDYVAAINLYDEWVGSTVDSNILDICDAASLLQRLEFEGVNVGTRWQKVYDSCKSHTDDHALTFNDMHFMMANLGAKQDEAASMFLESITEFVRDKGTDHSVATVFKEAGIPICEALMAYHSGSFAKAVDILHPVKYKTDQISGSNAQKDVVNLLLIQSAIKSPEDTQNLLARRLLQERKELKPCSPMTDRLLGKVIDLNID